MTIDDNDEIYIYIPPKISSSSSPNLPVTIPSSSSNNEEDDTTNLGDAIMSLQRYFFSRLVQVILFLGGKRSLTNDWHTEVHRKMNGQSKGVITVMYVSDKGKKCKSRVEVAVVLGLLPAIRSTKTMTRSQYFITAMETRERLLISQHLIAINGKCDAITYLNDFISITNNSSFGQKTLEFPGSSIFAIPEGSDIMPVSRCFLKFQDEFPISNFLFIFGNIGILSWGRLYPDAAFHNETQLYPIGFKCVRIEHDMFLNTLIGCLCEIDALSQEIIENDVIQKKLVPVFKITVIWLINSNRREVRFYVGNTPEQVWSKVNSETLGLPYNFDSNKVFFGTIPDKTKKTTKSFKSLKENDSRSNSTGEVNNKNINNDIDDSFEYKDCNEKDMEDENEKKIDFEMSSDVIAKNEVTSSTSSLSLESPDISNNSASPGSINNTPRDTPREVSTPVTAFCRTRLIPMDSINLFVDHGLMRLIEGMHGALDCKEYSFVVFREADSGSNRNGVLNDLTRLHNKTKLLDKVAKAHEIYYRQVQEDANVKSKVEKSINKNNDEKKKQKIANLIESVDDKKTKKLKSVLNNELNGN